MAKTAGRAPTARIGQEAQDRTAKTVGHVPMAITDPEAQGRTVRLAAIPIRTGGLIIITVRRIVPAATDSRLTEAAEQEDPAAVKEPVRRAERLLPLKKQRSMQSLQKATASKSGKNVQKPLRPRTKKKASRKIMNLQGARQRPIKQAGGKIAATQRNRLKSLKRSCPLQ
jgi:hypothetical protein